VVVVVVVLVVVVVVVLVVVVVVVLVVVVVVLVVGAFVVAADVNRTVVGSSDGAGISTVVNVVVESTVVSSRVQADGVVIVESVIISCVDVPS